MLLALVASGHAVTLLPELALRELRPGIAVRPVADAELTRTLFTAVRAGADRRPALAAVRAALRVRPGSPASRPGRSGTSRSRGRPS
jgi:DNA-binding transcriptional LysR family regulator